jgi:hypothetical protein
MRRAIVLEVIGVAGITAGIALEIVLHADIGLFVITGGSVLVAAGGLVWSKVYRKAQ